MSRSSDMSDRPVYRAASAEDSRFIAEMIDMSSEGIALIEWTQAAQAAGDRTALDIGASVYASEAGDYSYRNCCVAEVAARRAGILLSFPMPARDPSDVAPPPPFDGRDVFAPYKYLEAPDSWYICGVALLPEYRGRGIGTALMLNARQQARQQGYKQLSLVVFEENADAVRLYRRLGYETIKRAPIIPHPLIRASGDALLMVAPVS
jgi:ribosomal protein S18 acetylase RimI-like enzyme